MQEKKDLEKTNKELTRQITQSKFDSMSEQVTEPLKNSIAGDSVQLQPQEIEVSTVEGEQQPFKRVPSDQGEPLAYDSLEVIHTETQLNMRHSDLVSSSRGTDNLLGDNASEPCGSARNEVCVQVSKGIVMCFDDVDKNE